MEGFFWGGRGITNSNKLSGIGPFFRGKPKLLAGGNDTWNEPKETRFRAKLGN